MSTPFTDEQLDAAEAAVVEAWQRLDPEGYQRHLDDELYAAYYPTRQTKENNR